MVEVEGTIRTPGMSPQLTFTSQIGPLVHASHSRESQSMKRLVILPYLLSFIIVIETEDPAVIGLKNKFSAWTFILTREWGPFFAIVDC